MSSQSHPEPTEAPSRRSLLLRGAGAAGAVGLVAAAGVGAAGGVAAAATRPAPDNRPAAAEPAAGAPLVVYLRDAASGELDIFSGTSHTVLRDRALAARLTSAAR